ncbi:hypothetical protein DEU56DRAFT_920550 [Suillus clintonianus]|uniref:uncharacterized protein n=1 Tax=Suillus clintonianus TaxID=1904413 RepID=UPI001B885063|nr:uncharacterized protein DEU56DRAFT_920550 [Suillus clintonianus]KAG2107809.1 hypothetical protein DEU56DRAFT_920550 [Suillus clintonianus]
MTTGRNTTKLRGQVREMIPGWHSGVSEDSVPSVAYQLIMTCLRRQMGGGIEWLTEGEVRNPCQHHFVCRTCTSDAALKNDECYWRELTQDEWEAKKESFEQQVLNGTIKGRAARSDKGISRKRGSKQTHKSRETVNTDGSEDENNQENGDEEPETINTQEQHQELNGNQREDTHLENDITMTDDMMLRPDSLGTLPTPPLDYDLDPFDPEVLRMFLESQDLPYEPLHGAGTSTLTPADGYVF